MTADFLFLFDLLHVQPQTLKQLLVPACFGIVRGQQTFTVKHRVGAGEKTQRLGLVTHLRTPCREPHIGLGHQDAGNSNGAHELQRIQRIGILQRSTFDLDQHVDGYGLRVLRLVCQLLQQAHPVATLFPHTENPS